jgi:hypothetical protein
VTSPSTRLTGGTDAWIARRWWWFLIVPALAAGVFFLVEPVARGGSFYLSQGASDPYAYGWLVLPLFVPYAIGLWAIARTRTGPSARSVLIGYCVVALPYALAPLAQSRDAFQYLFYAQMQLVHGTNPYVTAPTAFTRDAWFAFVGWTRRPSVYGPAWTSLVTGIRAVTGRRLVAGLLALKALATAACGTTVWSLARLRPGRGDGIDPRGALAAAAFAFDPLVLLSGPMGAHPDAVLAALFAGAILLNQRGRPNAAGMLLATAALVKSYAAVAFAVFAYARWRRTGVRSLGLVAGAVALAAACYAPFWAGWRTFESTVTMGGQVSSSLGGTVRSWLDAALASAGLARHAWLASAVVLGVAVALLVAVGAAVARSERTIHEPWRAAAILLGTFFLVTPWFLPWYTVCLLALGVPLTDIELGSPAVLFSATSLVQVPGLAHLTRTTLRYGPPAALWWRLRRGRPGWLVRTRREPAPGEGPAKAA